VFSVALLGAGESSRTPVSGRTALDMGGEAVLAALDDAGIEVGQVDGFVSGYSLVDDHLDLSSDLAEHVGIHPRWSGTLSRSGSTGASLVIEAAMAIQAGVCDTAVAVWADNRVSGPAGDMAGLLAGELSEFEVATGPLIATQYALIARAYMAATGTTSEDLAEVAVQFRAHAGLNEHAKYRDAITVADVLASTEVTSPLHRLECALVTDFGGAVVLTRDDLVAPGADAVRLRGFGEALSHQSILRNPRLFDGGETAAAASARDAFAMAGMTPADLRMAQLYDCFTITVAMVAADFGLCARQEVGAAFRDGHFDRAGSLPTNTAGGLLSNASGGILLVTEAVRQMRGTAGAHQLAERPETAIVHGNGGILAAQTTLLLEQRG
jgi:acetyl-CoA acetyltransferase